MFTPDEELRLKKVAKKEKLGEEIVALETERNVLYKAKETELAEEKIKTEDKVNLKHMPAIDAKDAEIASKETEIEAL